MASIIIRIPFDGSAIRVEAETVEEAFNKMAEYMKKNMYARINGEEVPFSKPVKDEDYLCFD